MGCVHHNIFTAAFRHLKRIPNMELHGAELWGRFTIDGGAVLGAHFYEEEGPTLVVYKGHMDSGDAGVLKHVVHDLHVAAQEVVWVLIDGMLPNRCETLTQMRFTKEHPPKSCCLPFPGPTDNKIITSALGDAKTLPAQCS